MPITDESSAGQVADHLGVSRETAERLQIYVDGLRRWQRVTNLVGPGTLSAVWDRHVADSLQLADLMPGKVWVDLGTGAGLPGLVLAIARPEKVMHLVESDGRKCAFLRDMIRLTGAAAHVWCGRIDAVLGRLLPTPSVVTARALAPLPSLLNMSQCLLRTGAVGLFPKGRDFELELTQARESSRFDVDILPSRTDSSARILRITNFEGEAPSGPTERSRGERPAD